MKLPVVYRNAPVSRFDDKYGRILAYVFKDCTTHFGCDNGRRMINWVMIKKDLAEFVSYEDRRELKYKELLNSN